MHTIGKYRFQIGYIFIFFIDFSKLGCLLKINHLLHPRTNQVTAVCMPGGNSIPTNELANQLARKILQKITGSEPSLTIIRAAADDRAPILAFRSRYAGSQPNTVYNSDENMAV